MNVQLKKAELEQFIQAQVNAGNFPSPEAVVEASLTQMMESAIQLTDADVAAIQESDEQFDRGEGISSKEVAARMKNMYGSYQNGPPRQ